MSKKHVSTATPAKVDDLKAINGVGPGVEKRLHGVGIFTYAQLAALSSADIAAAVADLTGLSAERIIKQDWIGQARRLEEMSDHIEESPQDLLLDSILVRKPYRTATFTVEFLIDASDALLQVRAVHMQDLSEQSWTTWQRTQFEDFLSRCAGLHFAPDQPTVPEVGITESIPVDGKESVLLPPSMVKHDLAGVLRLRDMVTIGIESEGPRRVLLHNEPFDVRLTLDLSEMTVPENSLIRYKASIFGKNRASRSGQFAREAEGTLIPADMVMIDLEGNILPVGTYQLAATVMLGLSSKKLTPKTGSVALIDGGMVQVV